MTWRKRRTLSRIHFLVDTGAFDIALSEDDAYALGVELDDLSKSRRPIGGIGGTVNTFDLLGVSIAFLSEGQSKHEFRLARIRVIENPRERPGGRAETRIPSLLGRAFLKRNGFTFYCDFGSEAAYLECRP